MQDVAAGRRGHEVPLHLHFERESYTKQPDMAAEKDPALCQCLWHDGVSREYETTQAESGLFLALATMNVVVQRKSEGEAEGIEEDRHVKGKCVPT